MDKSQIQLCGKFLNAMSSLKYYGKQLGLSDTDTLNEFSDYLFNSQKPSNNA